MVKKFFILFLIFYFLALFQTSFLLHFQILGQVPNLVLIFLFLILFFSPSNSRISWEALLAGFFLDLFSNNPFGVSMLILFLAAFLMKKILKNIKKTNLLVAIFLFLLFQGFYYFLIYIFQNVWT